MFNLEVKILSWENQFFLQNQDFSEKKLQKILNGKYHFFCWKIFFFFVGVHNLKSTFSMVMVVFLYSRFQWYEIFKYLLFAYKRMVFGYSKMILRRLYPIINHSRSAIRPSTIGFSLTNLLFTAIQKR